MKNQKQLFNLNILVGNWESVNLNPTVIIYKNNNIYMLSIIYINETSKQARPATYEIQENEGGYYIYLNFKRKVVSYNAQMDTLNISSLGDYMRN